MDKDKERDNCDDEKLPDGVERTKPGAPQPLDAPPGGPSPPPPSPPAPIEP